MVVKPGQTLLKMLLYNTYLGLNFTTILFTTMHCNGTRELNAQPKIPGTRDKLSVFWFHF